MCVTHDVDSHACMRMKVSGHGYVVVRIIRFLLARFPCVGGPFLDSILVLNDVILELILLCLQELPVVVAGIMDGSNQNIELM